MPGQAKREKFTLTREMIHVETVLGDRRKADDNWDFMLDDKNQIGYIRITAFSRETAHDLQDGPGRSQAAATSAG